MLKGWLSSLRTASSALFVLGLLYLLNRENGGYIGVNPHPYLLVACIVGASLGFVRSLFVNPLIAATYLYFLQARTDMQVDEAVFTQENLVLPFTMLALPALLGAMTDRQRARIRDNERNLAKQNELNEDLVCLNGGLRAQSSQVERRLASHMQSVTRVFEYAQILETIDLERLCQTLADIVREQLGEANCYIYVYHDSTDAPELRRMAFRDDGAPPFPAVISDADLRNYPLIERVVRTRELVHGENGAPGEQGIATPLITASGQLLGVIALRSLHFLNHVPSTFATVRALGRWGGMSISRAHHVRTSRENAFMDEATGLFSYGYFKKRVSAEFQRARTYSLPLHLLRFEVPQMRKMDAPAAYALSRLMGNSLQAIRREVDVATQGPEPESFYVILAIASPQEIEACKAKVREEFERVKTQFDGGEQIELLTHETAINRGQKDVNEFLAAETRR